jgi:hypothetical protein
MMVIPSLVLPRFDHILEMIDYWLYHTDKLQTHEKSLYMMVSRVNHSKFFSFKFYNYELWTFAQKLGYPPKHRNGCVHQSAKKCKKQRHIMRTIYYQYIRFAFVKISLAGSISGFEPANICTERTQVFSTVAIELKKTMRMYVRMIYSCNHL